MKAVTLSPRLSMIASLVPQGSVPVDVGTDHAYIPAWLLTNGVVRECIATDINKGPLASAEENLRAAGVADKCRLLLCDGLAGCVEGSADTIIIAGMGGDNIAGILERAPWTKNGCLLILQPMSKSERLRAWLCENGYAISSERLVRDAGKLYPIITAVGSDVAQSLTKAEMYTGGLELISKDPLYPELVCELADKFRRAVDSQSAAEQRPEHLDDMAALMQEFIKMKEDIR